MAETAEQIIYPKRWSEAKILIPGVLITYRQGPAADQCSADGGVASGNRCRFCHDSGSNARAASFSDQNEEIELDHQSVAGESARRKSNDDALVTDVILPFPEPSDNKCMFIVEVAGHKIRGLVSTACARTLIDYFLVKHLRLASTNAIATNMAGHPVALKGEKHLEYKYTNKNGNKKTKIMNTLVAEKLARPLIIGIDFMRMVSMELQSSREPICVAN